MKKSLAVLICCIMFILGGCSKKPTGMKESNYNVSKNILKTVDQYIDGDISSDDAYKKLDDLRGRLDDNDDSAAFDVSIRTSTVVIELIDKYTGTPDISRIKEAREEIADIINE